MVMVPHNQIIALPCEDVVGTVAARAKVHERTAAHVLVSLVELAVLRHAAVAADGERRAGEVASQANVERDIGIVGVHVEAKVLAGLVLNHERVMIGESAFGLQREKDLGERMEHMALQPRDRLLHADVVHDDTIFRTEARAHRPVSAGRGEQRKELASG